MNSLKRYGSPLDVAKWLRTTQLKISAGELKEVRQAPGKDAKPEEIAAWRKEQGLPDDAASYVKELKLEGGVNPGEMDKPLIDMFAAHAHAKGMTQAQFNDTLGWWFETQDKLAAARESADADNRIAAEQDLLKVMGADFKPNMNALKSFWSEAPQGIQNLVLGARLEDGRMVGDIPEVVQFFVQVARELNPAATLLPPGTGDGPKALAARKSEIEGQMYADGKPNPAYFGGPLEKEYREILEAEERMSSRGRAA